MLQTCKGIVLQTIPYSDSSSILKCYTDKFGLQSYMISGLRGKKNSIKPSHLQSLSLLEMVVYHQQNKNLQRIKELKCLPVLSTLHFNNYKRTIAIFLTELLGKVIKEESEPDENLFSFLFAAIQMADISDSNLPNFPAAFLVQLSKYLGFFPKNNYSANTSVFSLQEGVFVEDGFRNKDYCSGQVASELHKLLNQNFEDAISDSFNLPNRKAILQVMLRYYQLHLLMFGELKSPQILHEVFTD
ncbi:MAG: DNA repair protein RecO [Bacteroidia bacterium]|nr:DNA repair protein RecO [Bacteroidia bacterium]